MILLFKIFFAIMSRILFEKKYISVAMNALTKMYFLFSYLAGKIIRV